MIYGTKISAMSPALACCWLTTVSNKAMMFCSLNEITVQHMIIVLVFFLIPLTLLNA